MRRFVLVRRGEESEGGRGQEHTPSPSLHKNARLDDAGACSKAGSSLDAINKGLSAILNDRRYFFVSGHRVDTALLHAHRLPHAVCNERRPAVSRLSSYRCVRARKTSALESPHSKRSDRLLLHGGSGLEPRSTCVSRAARCHTGASLGSRADLTTRSSRWSGHSLRHRASVQTERGERGVVHRGRASAALGART